jgi:hypothetical protein
LSLFCSLMRCIFFCRKSILLVRICVEFMSSFFLEGHFRRVILEALDVCFAVRTPSPMSLCLGYVTAVAAILYLTAAWTSRREIVIRYIVSFIIVASVLHRIVSAIKLDLPEPMNIFTICCIEIMCCIIFSMIVYHSQFLEALILLTHKRSAFSMVFHKKKLDISSYIEAIHSYRQSMYCLHWIQFHANKYQ